MTSNYEGVSEGRDDWAMRANEVDSSAHQLELLILGLPDGFGVLCEVEQPKTLRSLGVKLCWLDGGCSYERECQNDEASEGESHSNEMRTSSLGDGRGE